MARGDFELDTTIRKAFRQERLAAFSREPTWSDRLLEWTIPALWLVVAAVIAAVFIWL